MVVKPDAPQTKGALASAATKPTVKGPEASPAPAVVETLPESKIAALKDLLAQMEQAGR